jgi:hypothetical protein
MPPASGLARDYWHWSKDHNRWDLRADIRSDRRDLEEARRQLEYDNSHHARREKLAEDNARIKDIELIFVAIERGEGNTILEGHKSTVILSVATACCDTPKPLRVA